MSEGNEKRDLTPDEIFALEERCTKAIQTVTKAIVMRIMVSGLLIWIVAAVNHSALVIGLTVFVLLINLTGLLPLAGELKKRLAEQKKLRAMEPD